MNSPPSSLSRRGFLTTAGTLGTAVGLGSARTTTTLGTTTSTKDAPKPAWTYPKGPDASSRLVYPAATTNGILIAIVVADTQKRKSRYTVVGLDTDSGHVEWSKTYPVVYVPAVDDDTVYLSTRTDPNENSNAETVAIDVNTGAERWTTRKAPFAEFLTVHDGTLYVVSRGNDGEAVTIDTKSGNIRWRSSIDSEYVSQLQFSNDAVFIEGNHHLHSLSAEDGNERWSKSLDSSLPILYSETEGNLYLDSKATVYALDPKDGSEVWSAKGDGELALHDGTLYSWGDSLKAMDPTDGSVQWEYGGGDLQFDQPIVADGGVFGMGRESTIYAIETDGTRRWKKKLDTSNAVVRPTLQVRDEAVYVGLGRELMVLSTKDGSLKWSFTAKARMIHTLVTDDDVFFGVRNKLYTFARHHSLLSTAVDETTGFISSGPGLALSGVLVGTAAFAAYRRLNDDEDSVLAAESPAEPKLEYGRLERLSADEFTETYRVRKRTDDGPKVVAERQLTKPRVAGTFHSVVERWAELNDRSGVVPVLETDRDSIELPYYEDGSLADSDGSVPERFDALSAASTVVHDAHADGLIHGGLTPSSIFLDGDDVHVADWELGSALAKFRNSSDPSPYDAPEQVAEEEADERTDVYRLGAIAAFILTGKHPDEGSLRALDPEHREVMLARADSREFEAIREESYSDELHEIVSKAMAEDPNDRYESVVAFDDMHRWAAFRT